jgi:peptidyl-prolyl cis-trans isomerase C
MRVLRTFVIVTAVMVVLSGMPAWSQPTAETAKNSLGAGQPPDASKTVATVNGTVINEAKLDAAVAGIRRHMARQGQVIPDEALTQIRANVLDHLIGEELLYQESRRQGVAADEKAIQEELAAIRQNFKDEQAFDSALTAAGMSKDLLAERMRRQSSIEKIIETRIIPEVKVTDDQANAFYTAHPDLFASPEQVRARHILVRADKNAEAAERSAARQRLADIRQKAMAGEDFAALAQAHSEDPGSKEKGGDLGFFGRGSMVKPFEEASFALALNQISEIVETEYGYHLIQVTERKAAGTVSFQEAKPRILEHLKQQQIRERTESYVENLRKGAKIEKSL